MSISEGRILTRKAGFSVSEAFGGFRLWWLVLPAFLFFLAFFLVPVISLLAISLNKTVPGVVTLTSNLTLDNFVRIFTRAIYYEAIIRSIVIGVVVAAVALALGYPLAFLIAKTEHPTRNTILMVLVLSAMQLDMVIRMYGLMVLMGDTGLINSALMWLGITSAPLPLMYNTFGVVVGLVQVTLPFMVLSLIGIIRAIHPSLEEAARSLGATRGEAFRKVVLPLSMPGILAGSLLVFALSISSYVVPALMGGWKVVVLPIHIYQQIAEAGRWQFGAAVAAVLFVTSLIAVFVYHRAAVFTSGGRT
ncbi:putative spermidine/putrescine transport system permease protein [Kaistia hirudinis]|uniref:Putative spermidine/putrescine transport system permease protein n=1 Tax=Kaistia hirudinis TaxID=1293440 RepID=A0A840AQ01_9HYPH|nr:ABC transporter permease [Kaistia hirudinis]MBB3931368.1 putative spermidine/putrescine transport system permease protein [Kaistia hirudinis]